MATKKLINDPANIIDEMLEGAIAAHPRLRQRLAGETHAVVDRGPPRPGKVGLVIGGGSGHEPTFLGFVGKGWPTLRRSATCSPRRRPTRSSTAPGRSSGGAGVLFMYGNYAGDVMNFDMAAEMAAVDGHRGPHGR